MHEKIAKFVKFAENHWYKNNILLWTVSMRKEDWWIKVKCISNISWELISKEFINAITKWLKIKWYSNYCWMIDKRILVSDIAYAMYEDNLVWFIDSLWLWI